MPDDDDKLPDLVPVPVAEVPKREIPSEEATIAEAQKAWERIRGNATKLWADWLKIGWALLYGRIYAIYKSGSNDAKGGKYSRAFNEWLSANDFEDMAPNARANLLKIMDDLDAVTEWRNGLKKPQQYQWNYPDTVWKQFQAWKRREGIHNDGKPPRPKQVKIDQAELQALRDQNEALQIEINQGGVAERDTIGEVLKAVDRRFEDDDLADLIDGLITMAHRRGINKTWGRKRPVNNTDSTADGPGIPQP